MDWGLSDTDRREGSCMRVPGSAREVGVGDRTGKKEGIERNMGRSEERETE